MCLRPGADHLSLALASDTHIWAVGKLVANKTKSARYSDTDNANDGVGRRITEPSLAKRDLLRREVGDCATGHQSVAADQACPVRRV